MSTEATSPGSAIILAVIRAKAIRGAIVNEDGCIIVWTANSPEQLEAAIEEFGYKLIPIEQNQLS